MFNKEKTTSLDNNQFIIVYDKLTKPIAKSLFNYPYGKYTCVLWSKNDYLGNEAKLKNTNKVLFFDEDLIKENLLTSCNKIDLNESVILSVQGSAAGMFINPDANITPFGDLFKENWGKLILGLIASGLIGSSLLLWFLSFDKKKRARFKILLDTVQDFKDSDTFKRFMNGTIY